MKSIDEVLSDLRKTCDYDDSYFILLHHDRNKGVAYATNGDNRACYSLFRTIIGNMSHDGLNEQFTQPVVRAVMDDFIFTMNNHASNNVVNLLTKPADNWTPEMVDQLIDYWDAYRKEHANVSLYYDHEGELNILTNNRKLAHDLVDDIVEYSMDYDQNLYHFVSFSMEIEGIRSLLSMPKYAKYNVKIVHEDTSLRKRDN